MLARRILLLVCSLSQALAKAATRAGAGEAGHVAGAPGTIESGPRSTDGRRFAIALDEPAAPTLRVAFFTPRDVAPPRGVVERLGRVAEAAERFFVDWMRRWGYAPANEQVFRRRPDGSLEVHYVRGEHPLAGGRYRKPTPDLADEVARKATEQARIAGNHHVWWIFTYFGDPPMRIDEYAGHGDPREGGWGIVNYSTIAGEVRPDLGLATGFNAEFTLKGCIHELGHGFGLPHIGPIPGRGLGNSLMGPNNSVYAARKLPKPDQVHLSEAAAAMLWKHPIFAGPGKDRALRPTVSLSRYEAKFSRDPEHATLTGKLTSDVPAHSVVVLDDVGHPEDTYWYRGYGARLLPDGTFRVVIEAPVLTEGHYLILFCFDNGVVCGDGKEPAYYGAIRKAYRTRDGRLVFEG